MICTHGAQASKPVRQYGRVILGRGASSCQKPRRHSANPSTGSISSSTSGATTALSITASAAVSALIAKVTALIATGVAPGMLLAALQPSSAIFKPSEKAHESSSALQMALADKIAVVRAPVPNALTASINLPSDWLVVYSAVEWFDQNRQAAATGALLATVFISDKSAVAHAPLFERLRRNFGSGSDAPIRFVFVHIADGYFERHLAATSGAAAAASLPRGSQGLTVGRVSHTAAVHGLDVALSSFLPDGIRAFPSLLLTAGPKADGNVSGAHWAAATRVEELTQLVSDWAFINRHKAPERKRPTGVVAVEGEGTAESQPLAAAASDGPVHAARRTKAVWTAGPPVKVKQLVRQQQPPQQQREKASVVGSW